MGYYTYYTLQANDAKTNLPVNEAMERKICERLFEISKGAIFEDETFDHCLSDSLKWYRHEEDLVELSKEFPEVTFLLEGEGEDRDDMWRFFVCNGECEIVEAVITYEQPSNPKFRCTAFY